jgi:hypothetical protein
MVPDRLEGGFGGLCGNASEALLVLTTLQEVNEVFDFSSLLRQEALGFSSSNWSSRLPMAHTRSRVGA